MSTRRKTSKTPIRLIAPEKRAVIDSYTKGAVGVLRAIREGTVDELELDKLHNFVITTTVLMELVPLETFREAQRIAEFRSLVQTGLPVVMDKSKIGAT
jgi:hypothetical protein